jgi:hypothetical protein
VRIEVAVLFPAPVEVVVTMLEDEAYISRKATAMGALEHDVTVTSLGSGRTRIRLQRTLPSVVPDFVKPLVGPTIDVVQTEDWAAPSPDGTRRGDLRAQIGGAPVSLSGSMSLHPTDDGATLHRVEVLVRAKVPFVGGRIEKSIGDVLVMAARKEEEVGAAWLAENR